MLKSVRERLLVRKNNSEEGNDIIVTLIMLPFVLALLFSMIDVSTYFQTKTQIQNVVRDGARQVSLYGGTSATLALNKEQHGGVGVNVTNEVKGKLWGTSGCKLSMCIKEPVVQCGPSKSTSLDTDAYCTVTYYYKNMSMALTKWLGLDALSNKTIKLTETFKVETKWR